ncbi:hypothetical protein C0992_002602 [Termitomyces sp. T32_za158]|nr:hypothetical protein C0992_002602 [Termitomyces sp. T32_za158]
MGRAKASSVSRKVRMRNLDVPRKKGSGNKQYGLKGLQQERERTEARYQRSIQGLSNESRQVLAEIQGTATSDTATFNTFTANDHPDAWEDDNDGFNVPDESLEFAARDFVDSRFHAQYCTDGRTWHQRIQRMQQNWEPLMEDLADAYLAWKYPTDASTPESDFVPEYDYTMTSVDLYTLEMHITVHCTEASTSLAADIVRHGYLGATPESPSIALSLRTLELYHRIRRRKPSFGIEAFTKVLSDLYMIPYHWQYCDTLSNAFDVYLTLQRIIDKRVAKELGRDTENWRVLNGCPPCSYVLEDEPPLRFSRMFAMDGNNSLKRVGDLRTFEDSHFYLSNNYVNKFAHEVKGSRTTPTINVAHVELPQSSNHHESPTSVPDNVSDLHDSPTFVPDNDFGDPTDGGTENAGHNPCAENWKAAANESNKNMWAIFNETGIFAAACRHGLILWIVDMFRSSELAKYPLAIVAKLLEILPPEFLLGYDIGCVFQGTIDRSSLGKLFEERQCQCCVNAFHGYSHNFQCQVQNHPNIIEGMGIEDLETLKCIFSSSNQLASVTRYMSKHRQRVFIDLFFSQWDADKYENLGNMLYNNYSQALKIINIDGPELKHAKEQLKVNDQDLKNWRMEQKEYFANLGKEPEEHVHKIAYVERLQELRAAE